MSGLARIALVAGNTPAACVVAGAVTSLLTAVGRWVEEIPAGADLAPYALVILPRARGWQAVRERCAAPLLVVDADLLDGKVERAFRDRLSGTCVASLGVRETHALLPRPLPPLVGPALGDVPAGLAIESGRATGYALPFVVTPALRTVAGFWSLARALEEAVAALVGEPRPLYADPWPRGFRAARALTYDLDGLERSVLPSLVTGGRPATLFCCADALDRLGAARALEVAAHGDVHRGFADERTNLARVDRVRDAFRASGLEARGFSPPNSTYTSALAPLCARFSYLRLGYQERTLRFYPQPAHGATLYSASYYPDFLQRYVGAEEYARLLGRFCAWAAATSVLAVPCFHPCLWPAPLRRFLDLPVGAVWEGTLADVTDWWAHRRRALEAMAMAGEGAGAPDVALARATPAERLAALRPFDGEPGVAPRVRSAARVVVAGRRVRVVPAAEGPAAAVDVPLGNAWRPLGWLPARLHRGLVRVANKNGLHACFYGELGLAPAIVDGGIRLPVVAADEPVMMIHPLLESLRGLGRRVARRFGAGGREVGADPHA